MGEKSGKRISWNCGTVVIEVASKAEVQVRIPLWILKKIANIDVSFVRFKTHNGRFLNKMCE